MTKQQKRVTSETACLIAKKAGRPVNLSDILEAREIMRQIIERRGL